MMMLHGAHSPLSQNSLNTGQPKGHSELLFHIFMHHKDSASVLLDGLSGEGKGYITPLLLTGITERHNQTDISSSGLQLQYADTPKGRIIDNTSYSAPRVT